MRAGSGGLIYYHRGQQYSVIALTNGGGTVTERYAYSAYGTPTITDDAGTTLTTSAENNRYTYTGREYDEALGLYHYRARMYDSVAGRFCSRDPIGYWDGLSLYQGYFIPWGTDPSGRASTAWHHLLPWKWGEAFGTRGFDINNNHWGYDLPADVHSQLESAGWGAEWNDFFHDWDNGGRLPTVAEIRTKVAEMMTDPRFEPLLNQGTPSTGRYPSETTRKGWDKIIDGLKKHGGKGKKLLAILAGLGIGGAIAQPAYALCGGSCNHERRSFELSLEKFQYAQKQFNCQDVADDLRTLLECIGTDDATNGIQYIGVMTRICTKF
ncbi:RHS repeat-associated core domain-containing protein [Neorhodopirellula pilleata]|uniref:tRNA(Glu)-specific nuclease WapA n=1 Tax=Neorhodopirellula pilleata TaxID=2714738 RepID=A0A5C6A283_9BACT|nr:RHS repeat-associated core domain-containing protein [Neorhodopirellula pilleata]TWT92603.1 tRNA(Glu)-specific nuclease WapA precursor [Neorhodopirellula pilleata]